MRYPGTRWVMGRSQLKTLKETTLNSFFAVARMLNLKAGTHFKFNQQSNIIYFANGSEILLKDLYLYPTDPNFDELGSLEITGAFVDECNQIVHKAWEVLFSRIRYRLDEYGLIPKILGTCNPSKGWVFKNFYKPWEMGKENVLEPGDDPNRPIRRFVQALVQDNPDISIHYIKNLLSLSDNASRQRLLYGNWNYDDNRYKLCTYDSILSLFGGNIVDKPGRFYLTADIARHGADQAIIAIWDGYVVIDFLTFAVSKTTEIQDAINQFRRQYKIPKHRCIADDDGVGGGVVDNCDILGFVNGGKPFEMMDREDYEFKEFDQVEQYYNLQSQCGYKLAEKVNANVMGIDCPDLMSSEIRDAIIEDLEQLQSWETDKDRPGLRIKPKIEIKKETNRSPDWRDVLLMRMYFEYAEENQEDLRSIF